MDQPGISPDEHRRALAGLVTVNRLSRTAQSLLPPILKLARRLGRDELSLLDVACGGGDVPLALRQLAAQRSLRLGLILADRSDTALEQAGRLAGETPVRLVECEATSDELPEADVVTNSLFLHHLDEPEVIITLRHLATRTRHLLLVSDLVRSRAGWLVAWAACRAFSRSPVVRHDGPVSVRAAWTVAEMRDMCRAAGLEGVRIRRVWPWRMLISWRRDA